MGFKSLSLSFGYPGDLPSSSSKPLHVLIGLCLWEISERVHRKVVVYIAIPKEKNYWTGLRSDCDSIAAVPLTERISKADVHGLHYTYQVRKSELNKPHSNQSFWMGALA